MAHIEPADRPERLSVEHRMVEGIRVVTLRGEIDHDVQDVLRQALQAEGGAVPPRIVADLNAVTFMDSSGINVFVAAYQQLSDADGWVRIAGAQDSVLRVLQLVGVDTLIPCHPTTEQALTA
ncbi:MULTISPECIES: STAS domain-containing protein [Streptomyces]|uniref:Anti-sigma factor antagonist n=1 Tax=Streptomyces tibetensis TaxID=2382123 RepID=A0ABW6N6X9_9ACTN|nr:MULTISPECIES: STAS domain-containing protein [Streptomyces]PPS71028.1 anti-anti-sigma factor [Streptomyces sp. 46]